MVEIIPKPIKKTPLWLSILLYFSILVIVGVGATYFILGYFIEKNDTIFKEKQKILNQPRSEEDQRTKKKVFEYQKKINDFVVLFNKHQNSSNFFPFFEEIIHPQVWISSLDLNIQNAEVKISGEAEKTALGQQLLIFREDKQILKTNLSDIRPKEGEMVVFTISLSFNPDIFKFLE